MMHTGFWTQTHNHTFSCICSSCSTETCVLLLVLLLHPRTTILLSSELRQGKRQAPAHRHTSSIHSAVKPQQTHTQWNRHSLGAELGNHAAAPLARLIKLGHLCIIPHLEQVAPSPAGSSPLSTTFSLNNDDWKRHTRTSLSFNNVISSFKLDGAIKLSFVQQGQRGAKIPCAHLCFSAKRRIC